MRWSIIRLIWFRELRDQLRDRRTIFMVIVVPVVLYPILGILGLQFARSGSLPHPTPIAIQGIDFLPPLQPTSAGFSPLPACLWINLAAGGPGTPGAGGERIALLAALARNEELHEDNPPLVVAADNAGYWRFPECYVDQEEAEELLPVRPTGATQAQALLDSGEVDVVLVVPPDFRAQLDRGGRPILTVKGRPGDDNSQLATLRLHSVLDRWKQLLKKVRLRRLGVAEDYDDPFAALDPERAKTPLEQALASLHEQIIRIFPFMLVMWSLAGALYPAIDVCAGEKERGTMETLLISPASREEIVLGKFLTIWFFSTVATLWNLACMGGTAGVFSSFLPQPLLPAGALFWCTVSVVPLTAFFSAVCLALGVYARSSKEGQYYLMPLFLATMPLIFLTLAPGVHLNAFYSLVPITGVALLMQRLMATSDPSQVPWLYFVPVLSAVVLYSGLALRWAIEQFKREEVLFREAERLDLGLWVRRLFREKEARTSVGQALFCFVMVLVLRWLFFGTNGAHPSFAHRAVGYLTFLAPPLFMALLLTTQPRGGLGLRLPPWRCLGVAVALPGLLAWPLLEIGDFARSHFLRVQELLPPPPPLFPGGGHLVVLALLAALSEEVVFRGLILSGLRGRLSPGGAVLIGGLLFALSFMNAFWFLPAFTLGVVLGLLRLRSRSIVPGFLCHFLCLVGPATAVWLKEGAWGMVLADPNYAWIIRPLGLVLLIPAGLLLLRLARDVWHMEERRIPPDEE